MEKNSPIYFQYKMAEASTFFNEENIKVIRNISKEEFEKQEKNIGNLISGNFKITMEEIKKSQDEIKNLEKEIGKEICELRSSLEFTENVLEEKVKKLEERCENMETELQEFYNNQIDPEYIYNKLVDLEDSSRRLITLGLMVLLKRKVKLGSSVKRKFKIFLRKS